MSGTHPDIPAQKWTNPFEEGKPLHDEFDDVVRDGRDFVVLVDDFNADRGTGKTIASLLLAAGMDQTREGITPSKATLRPEELRNAYTREPQRSGLILDEGEVGASNRDHQTSTNKALREIMSMGRVEEKYVVINLPTKGFLDSSLLTLAHVWITMVRKGLGLVHMMDWEPYSEQRLTPRTQWIEFEDVPTDTQLREVYRDLTREKRDHMDGDGGQQFVPLEQHEEELEKARKQTRRDTRNEVIRSLFEHERVQNTALSQTMVADAVGLSQSQISNILSGE